MLLEAEFTPVISYVLTVFLCLQATASLRSVLPMWISWSCRRSAANPARGTSSLWTTLMPSTPSKKIWLPSFVRPQHHVSVQNIYGNKNRQETVEGSDQSCWICGNINSPSGSTACPLIFLNGFTSPGECKHDVGGRFDETVTDTEITAVLIICPEFLGQILRTCDVLCFRLQDARGVQPDR